VQLKETVKYLNNIFESHLAIEGDRVGLQIGSLDRDMKTILITLDITESVIDEAIENCADLILSHHPVLFELSPAITNESLPGKKIIKLIEHRIAVYVAHTNYDMLPDGLNSLLADKLELKNVSIIKPESKQWYKFVIFVPKEAEEKLRQVICAGGGGKWKNYSCCTFNIEGKGTFKPLEGSHPYTGRAGDLNFVDEVRIECVVSEDNVDALLKAAVEAHPYEEPAYDIYRIENKFMEYGIGRIGSIEAPENLKSLLDKLKEAFRISNFRWLVKDTAGIEKRLIQKIALINGSANSFSDTFSLPDFECDLVIVGELKYHRSLEIVESGKILVEIGHGESERLAVEGMYLKLSDFFNKHFSGNEEGERINIIKSKNAFVPWRYYIE